MNLFQQKQNFIISDLEQKRAMLDEMLLKIPEEELHELINLLCEEDISKLYETSPEIMRVIQGFAYMTLTDSPLPMNYAGGYVMESQSNDTTPIPSPTVKATQTQIQAMSAQQIISNSGKANMLQGRTIRLNVFVPKKP